MQLHKPREKEWEEYLMKLLQGRKEERKAETQMKFILRHFLGGAESLLSLPTLVF
jgi:hypothetical protein